MPASPARRRSSPTPGAETHRRAASPWSRTASRRSRPARWRSAHTSTGTPGSAARQHLWLVARVLHGLEHAIPIAHDHHAIVRAASRVPAAQDCRTLTHVEQHPRQRSDDGRLAAAANRQVANTDDRAIEASSRLRMPFVPRAPHPCDVSVGRAQNTQWITRKGRTTAGG